jgi:signal transduction histidine kinase
VADQGPGVPPEDRPQLFDRFFRSGAADHTAGMGLGLFISRQIVELHGGTIRAEFPPAGGTRVVVELDAT